MKTLGHLSNRNTKSGSRRNIAHHYDIGNAFYGKWLDPSMTYSSAVFEPGVEELEPAQRRKYRRIADMLHLEPGQTVLEIGCGWGGFASVAAREYGAASSASRSPRNSTTTPSNGRNARAFRTRSRSSYATTGTSTGALTISPPLRCSRRSASSIGRSFSIR